MLPSHHRPSRPGADLAVLLGLVPRQALGDSHPQQPESLGDVLSRSLPKTLQEALAEALGVDANAHVDETDAAGHDDQEPATDAAAAGSPPRKLDFPPLPPLPQLLDSISKWSAPLALTPGDSTGDIDHE